jgi:hypothetical protein
MDKDFLLYAGLSVVLFFALLLAMPYAFSLLPREPPDEEHLLDYTFFEHSELGEHVHPHLEIDIDGEKQAIPAEIGIGLDGMHVIHTHDGSGTIHIESPVSHQFYLRDFFAIWGRRFDSQCIFDRCVDGNHTLRAYVDGVESRLYGDIPLEDGQRITIVYQAEQKSPAQEESVGDPRSGHFSDWMHALSVTAASWAAMPAASSSPYVTSIWSRSCMT